MASKTQGAARLTHYLLDEISEAEREQLEEAYFADDNAFEQLLIAEDELVDAYVSEELSVEERRRFEKFFLASPRGRERMFFSRALAGAVSDARPAETTSETASLRRPSLFAALRFAALRLAPAAAVLCIAIIPWLLVERARMRNELWQLRNERAALTEKVQEIKQRAAAEQARSKELLAQFEGERVQQSKNGLQDAGVQRDDQAALLSRPSSGRGGVGPPQRGSGERQRNSTFMFSLMPGLIRGGGGKTLEVPRNASVITLRLNVDSSGLHLNAVPAPYLSFRAVIETAGGREVWRADGITPPVNESTLTLPAVPTRDLPPGDYVLLLSGKRSNEEFEGVADYSFRVVRK